jgi:hypothetical protein
MMNIPRQHIEPLPSGMRIETGTLKVGDDFTGVYIRGDNAMAYAVAIKASFDKNAPPLMRQLAASVLLGLERLLEASDEKKFCNVVKFRSGEQHNEK